MRKSVSKLVIQPRFRVEKKKERKRNVSELLTKNTKWKTIEKPENKRNI